MAAADKIKMMAGVSLGAPGPSLALMYSCRPLCDRNRSMAGNGTVGRRV